MSGMTASMVSDKETIMTPAQRFNLWLDERLNRRYPSRREALDAAGELESFTGGVRITARGHDCTLESLGYDSMTCDLPYSRDGVALTDQVDFGSDTPDEYLTVSSMGPMAFDRLQTVRDWLNGGFDVLEVYTLAPAGLIDCEPDEEPYVDASAWTVWCADRPRV